MDSAQARTDNSTTPLGQLTALQRDVLVVVARHDGEAGPTVVPAIQEFVDVQAADSVVYSNLSKLADMGHIRKLPDGRQRRYELTEQGTTAVNRLQNKMEAIHQ